MRQLVACGLVGESYILKATGKLSRKKARLLRTVKNKLNNWCQAHQTLSNAPLQGAATW